MEKYSIEMETEQAPIDEATSEWLELPEISVKDLVALTWAECIED